jgi:hypothetical protein
MAEREYERDELGRFGTAGTGGTTATADRPTTTGATDRPAPAPLSPRAQQNIAAVEQSIRNQDFETAAAVREDGTPVLRKDGAENRVDFTPAEADQLRGTVFTHNHPAGSSFSVDDVRMASMLGLREARVTTRDGTTYRMQAGSRGWPSADRVQSVGNRAREQSGRALLAEVQAGQTSREDAQSRWLHETWERAAPELGLVYAREGR